ncbi:MAG TPA: hypothetical protein EYP35_06850 [Desulfobacterales bacterium]|nr:hypothetical protein [Desulfobacterales bacterium]
MCVPLLRFTKLSDLNHRVARIFLTLFFILMVPSTFALACPEGELYWATENYLDQTFLYDPVEDYQGAVAALDYACQQYYGSNYEYFQIDSSANNFPAQKGGWCYYHTIVGPMPGVYYTAYLYCNEVKRDMFDDYSPCEALTPPLDKNKNLGKPPCPPS